MKKTIFILGLIIVSLILSGNRIARQNFKEFDAKIYYIDHSMLRLIPVKFEAGKTTTEGACKKVVEELIEGQDYNKRILRIIPDIPGCITVNVKRNTAIVNLKKDFILNLSDNKNHELLCIYSIVNSLTSIEGIDNVKFIFDGKEKKIYIGGIDMRETFIPDYYI